MILGAGIGLLIGVIVGALGAGGGILSLPVLVYVLGFEPHAAAAASLVIVGASALVSLLPHARTGNVQWGQGLVFGGLGAAGGLLGSRAARLVDAELLMVLLALLLLVVGVTMLLQARRNTRPARAEATTAARGRPVRPRRVLLTVVAASVSGLLTGLFGVGGGFVVVPALVLVLGVGMRAAVGTSLLVIVINTVVGMVGRIGESYPVDWWVVIAFTTASMIGGLVGARLANRARPSTLSALFGLLLTVVALATAGQAVPALVRG